MSREVRKIKTIPEIIAEQVEEVKEAICGSYCRYPITWDLRNGDLFESDICKNCPLNRL